MLNDFSCVRTMAAAAVVFLVVSLGLAQPTPAIEKLRRAVRENPSSAESRWELGAALAESGDLDAAIRELEVALNLRPDSANALYNLGSAYTQKARQAGAKGTAGDRKSTRLNS